MERMAEPTPEELELATRVIQDTMDRHPASLELIQQAQRMLSQEVRPFDVLRIFTSGTLANYEDNLRRLLDGYERKLREKKDVMGCTWSHLYSQISNYVLDSAERLRDRVGHLALPTRNDNYVNELARFWRTYGGQGGPVHSMSWYYEDCWTFVAGRVLILE